MGQVGHPLPLGGEQLVDPVGQQVEGLGRRRRSPAGPPTTARARGSPPARARLVRARSAAGRVTLRARRSVATTDDHEQHDGDHGRAPAHAVATPSVEQRVGDADPQHDDVVRRRARTGREDVDAAGDRLREGQLPVAGQRDGVRVGAALRRRPACRPGSSTAEPAVLPGRRARDGRLEAARVGGRRRGPGPARPGRARPR